MKYQYPTLIAALLFAAPLIAQENEPVKLQSGLKPAISTSQPAMPEQPDALRKKPAGELMDNAKPPAPTINAMPKARGGEQLSSGRGEQKASPTKTPAPVAGESHIQLVMEVSKSGKSRILSAVTVPGAAPDTKEVRGDFVYTAAFGKDLLSVQAIPDPFEMRAFPPPQDTAMQTGHHFQQADTARIVLTLPNAGAVQQRMDQLQLNFYKWTPKTHVHDIDVEQFQRALKGKELKKVVDIPAKELSPQLRANLKTLQ